MIIRISISLFLVLLFAFTTTVEIYAQPGGGRGRFNRGPVGPKKNPDELDIKDGIDQIKDRETFEQLSYKGSEVMIDTNLADWEFVKFQIEDASSDKPQLYFINTVTHRAHMMFMRAAGLTSSGFGRGRGGGGDNVEIKSMRGVLVYRPLAKSPSGNPGLYTFEFEPNDSYPFEYIKKANDILIEKMPLLKGNLGYHPRPFAIARYEKEKTDYEKAKLPVYLEKDFYAEIGYLPLNTGESFGRLRVMKLNERPSSRDIVLYRSLPNEMPRTAGIITTVRQTPLSHVNLRAIQDKVPNSYITQADQDKKIASLVGKNVFYKVTADGYKIRQATKEEVEKHFFAIRPSKALIPVRDLSVKTIKPLSELKFEDSKSVGVKAANLAAMSTFKLPEGTVPDGYALPFYFYDEFMKQNGFDKYAEQLLANREFRDDRDKQEIKLKEFRGLIAKGNMPANLSLALEKIQKSFPDGTSLRCRSSTNNEDLPGFSGAGLYESYTHKPNEGRLENSIKQVFASLWTFRAFEEREFHRIDHAKTAMGVLIHPNYEDESVNGVAVTSDILFSTYGNYYVNAQIGEDLVTNPEFQSVPEEILIGWFKRDGHKVMQKSNRTKDDKLVMSVEQVDLLRKHLSRIHSKFAKLYKTDLNDEDFAMEIEFKVTKDGKIAIKQARPWVR